jgi:hypothetical protein
LKEGCNDGIQKALYAGGHPGPLAKALNNFWAILHAWGIAPNYLVRLEIVTRNQIYETPSTGHQRTSDCWSIADPALVE